MVYQTVSAFLHSSLCVLQVDEVRCKQFIRVLRILYSIIKESNQLPLERPAIETRLIQYRFPLRSGKL
jgi:hypothetical protein